MKLLALAVLFSVPLWSCSGDVGGGDLCQQAAAHLAKCTGNTVPEAPATCDAARARAILGTGCGGRSAQSWLDDLCAFLGINCSGLGNGLGNGFTPGVGAGNGSCAGQCGSANDMGGCYCNADCVQFGDCCGDFAAACGANGNNNGGAGVGGNGSCAGQCGSTNDMGGCYCDIDCAQFGDCCGDFATACP